MDEYRPDDPRKQGEHTYGEAQGHTPKSRLYAHVKTGPQLDATEFPTRDWLIDKVVPHPSIGLLYAKDGVGKTWTAMALALAVANGGPWLHPEMRAPHPRPVLYIDGEMTEQDLQDRFRALNGGPAPETLHILSLAALADDLDLADPKHWADVQQLVTDFMVVDGDDLEAARAEIIAADPTLRVRIEQLKRFEIDPDQASMRRRGVSGELFELPR